ncbi:MAG: hypothetical protein QNK25_06300 [Desulfobacterales bacterium]|nr:hypothetical protein [Desulfobacterales bacterium]
MNEDGNFLSYQQCVMAGFIADSVPSNFIEKAAGYMNIGLGKKSLWGKMSR